MRCVHFVGFKDDRYWNAVAVFGRPHVIHRKWDARARRDIDFDNDIIVFADGNENQPVTRPNGNDIDERWLSSSPA